MMDISGDDAGSDIFDLIREEENESHLHRHRYIELGDDLLIWKMPAFDLEKAKVDELADKFRKRKALILDLRGNGGGAEETLLRLVGNVFDHDVKIGDLKARKDAKSVVAKSRGNNNFSGKLVVLIDSESGSASELFARVVQLEKRGIVAWHERGRNPSIMAQIMLKFGHDRSRRLSPRRSGLSGAHCPGTAQSAGRL